jgi:hypothetical protein
MIPQLIASSDAKTQKVVNTLPHRKMVAVISVPEKMVMKLIPKLPYQVPQLVLHMFLK